jgi:hypothetical protein
MTDFYARKPGTWSWELQSTLLFMMTSFLKSRTEAGIPSNSDFYDEDVNVYLAGLLAAYVDPQFMAISGRYISPFDIDVAQMARHSDQRSRYTIYKVNADHLLVMTGIFESQPITIDEGEPTPESRTAIGRGRTYYQMAASYSRALARRATAASEVLGKLGHGFPGYVTILHHLRSEYFNLIERFAERDMVEIHATIDHQAQKAEQNERVNRLLDLYSIWLRSGDPAQLAAMRPLVEEIRAVDPEFRFELPEA